jgi:DNA-binding YbaB/EbfC family protein
LKAQFSNFDFSNSKKQNMFGDLAGMMGKLKETQEKVKATKERLNSVTIEEKSSDSLLSVTITANRTVKAINIDDQLLEDKEQLEDYLVLTLNKAIEKATQVNEAELGAVAKEGMPNIPGMDSLFK